MFFLQESRGLARRHRHRHEAIAEQAGAAHGKFAPGGNLYVIINAQRHFHALTRLRQPRSARNPADLRAREQDVGSLQQAARIGETNRESIVSLKAFTDPAELNHERRQHRQTGDDKRANFQLQSFFALRGSHFLKLILTRV